MFILQIFPVDLNQNNQKNSKNLVDLNRIQIIDLKQVDLNLTTRLQRRA